MTQPQPEQPLYDRDYRPPGYQPVRKTTLPGLLAGVGALLAAVCQIARYVPVNLNAGFWIGVAGAVVLGVAAVVQAARPSP